MGKYKEMLLDKIYLLSMYKQLEVQCMNVGQSCPVLIGAGLVGPAEWGKKVGGWRPWVVGQPAREGTRPEEKGL